jgi:hypothetical protein
MVFPFSLVSKLRAWRKRGAGRRAAFRPILESLEDRTVPATMALDFSTYLGGSMFEHARDITTDSQGNVYVTGGTESANFPVTPGAYQTVHNPGTPSNTSISRFDVFVTKFSPTGQLLWSTFIGGPNYDRAYAIEVDSQGYVYVAGRAGAGFPVTAGAFQTSFQGGQEASFYGPQDGFIAKLTPDGSQLVWASYFGTSDPQIIRDIAIDRAGNVYLGSGYKSGTWTAGVSAAFQQGFQKTPQGGKDTVVAKVAADGSRLLWATYLGGSLDDGATPSLRVDAAGNVYVATSTTSSNMPTSATAYDRTYNGGQDFYIAKLSADGASLLYGTYLGGSGKESEETHNIEIDAQGNAYVTAGTTSANFPTTPGAFDRTLSGTDDIFAAKLSADGSQLLGSTYIGGSAGDFSQGIGVDGQGNVYISAGSHSTDFPVTAGAFQTTHGGGGDAVAIKLAADFSRLDYATFLGGSGNDEYRAAHVDGAGNFYLAGQATSTNLPTRNAFDTSYGGNTDSIVAKFIPVTTGNQTPTVATPAGATPNPVTGTTTSLSVLGADDGGEANLTYTWSSIGPASVSFSTNGTNAAKNTTAMFSAAGSYTMQVTIRDAGGLTATSSVNVTVNQTLTSITVAPATATVSVNGTQQFTATARDQFGNAMATQPAFTWSVSGGGTISATGLFTAGAAPGGPFTITASSSGKSGTASVSVVAQSTNLLSDPGFENNGQGWQKTTFGGRSIVSSPVHSGTKAQQMLVSSQYTRTVYQDLAVVAGATYDAAGWVKTSGVGGHGSSISLVWRNAQGTILRTDVLGTLTGTNEWTRLAGRYTAPTGATTVRFRLFTAVDPDNSGAAWFDDMEFIRVS